MGQVIPSPLDPAPAACLQRIVADSSDRIAWLRARSQGITATDAARLSTPKSIASAAWDKLNGSGFGGNPYTDHGRAREPVIAAWVQENYGIVPSTQLFHAAENHIHLATPDGLGIREHGRVELAEIKTTNKPFKTIPRNYLRQVFWQQYVLGAERTLFVWEPHKDFVPVHGEPLTRWVDRDDAEIADLISKADAMVAILRERTARARAYEDYGPAALRL
ncbi:YqaJ viral recombinase family protein [Paeniglutamicibacter psychrophenolicus]|uniref:YqaJ viral recombinase family protein n=1 Tax=Paeniglutamicibacter psychrophenolicus TaxID=257454 RepID=UPI0027D8CC89|nr:YqaJ viral recombinase family protein [Paeniglutamicibacter psychrophenolicus]